MWFYKEIDWLPDIPDELIDDLDTIRSRENTYPHPHQWHIYCSYRVSKELEDLLQSYFEKPMNVRYQVINKRLGVHIDHGGRPMTMDNGMPIKYNYIVQLGVNDIITRWWDDLDNPTQIIHTNYAPAFVWHELNTAIPHDITEIASPRVSIDIHEPI
jgi:hypothetical protein